MSWYNAYQYEQGFRGDISNTRDETCLADEPMGARQYTIISLPWLASKKNAMLTNTGTKLTRNSEHLTRLTFTPAFRISSSKRRVLPHSPALAQASIHPPYVYSSGCSPSFIISSIILVASHHLQVHTEYEALSTKYQEGIPMLREWFR